MISYNLDLKNSWLSFKKTDVVNKDILPHFNEKICYCLII